MKITSIESIPVVVPIDETRMIVGGRGRHDRSPFLIVRVHTDEGLVGLGEASCTPRWSGEDHGTAAYMITRYIEPLLVGRDPLNVERAMIDIAAIIYGNQFTKAA